MTERNRPDPKGKELATLSLAAIGVVFGDIGTSPIYALRESFHSSHGVPPTAENVLGVLSLIFWSLIIVISVKYLGMVLRADNRGDYKVLLRNGAEMKLTRTYKGRLEALLGESF